MTAGLWLSCPEEVQYSWIILHLQYFCFSEQVFQEHDMFPNMSKQSIAEG